MFQRRILSSSNSLLAQMFIITKKRGRGMKIDSGALLVMWAGSAAVNPSFNHVRQELPSTSRLHFLLLLICSLPFASHDLSL